MMAFSRQMTQGGHKRKPFWRNNTTKYDHHNKKQILLRVSEQSSFITWASSQKK
jgi:hypothetical protein